ncbi:MAG: OmpA family protein [Alphaproteobacteria bacterium]|nr:OmpA family protein [Alphaproteobacteria bacterium]
MLWKILWLALMVLLFAVAVMVNARAADSSTQLRFQFNRTTEIEMPLEQAVPPLPAQIVPVPPTSVGRPMTGEIDTTNAVARLTLRFMPNQTTLSQEARQQLDQIIPKLRDTPSMNARIMGYSSLPDDTRNATNAARQISLSRALGVRSYLMDQGISNFRIEVRALGNAARDGTADKVEIVLTGRN